mmetsp:Transcript_51154/g.116534  ORF Transcript_51154/g.116534 Transcript_51154/m.116534 type:complete len:355 (+) Transcript_51154:101-1165(+)
MWPSLVTTTRRPSSTTLSSSPSSSRCGEASSRGRTTTDSGASARPTLLTLRESFSNSSCKGDMKFAMFGMPQLVASGAAAERGVLGVTHPGPRAASLLRLVASGSPSGINNRNLSASMASSFPVMAPPGGPPGGTAEAAPWVGMSGKGMRCATAASATRPTIESRLSPSSRACAKMASAPLLSGGGSLFVAALLRGCPPERCRLRAAVVPRSRVTSRFESHCHFFWAAALRRSGDAAHATRGGRRSSRCGTIAQGSAAPAGDVADRALDLEDQPPPFDETDGHVCCCSETSLPAPSRVAVDASLAAPMSSPRQACELAEAAAGDGAGRAGGSEASRSGGVGSGPNLSASTSVAH